MVLPDIEGKLVFIYGEKQTGKTTLVRQLLQRYPDYSILTDIHADFTKIHANMALVIDCYLDILRDNLVEELLRNISLFLRDTNNICIVVSRERVIPGANYVFLQSSEPAKLEKLLANYSPDTIVPVGGGVVIPPSSVK